LFSTVQNADRHRNLATERGGCPNGDAWGRRQNSARRFTGREGFVDPPEVVADLG
jgi:hypothetical protein